MSEVAKFFEEVQENIRQLGKDEALRGFSRMWLRACTDSRYVYNFTWMGRPIIQVPQDIVALQELIWKIKPDVIVETGVAHGGSLIFHSSMLELLGGDRRVIGVDIDIRAHNRAEIESHPMAHRIDLIQGSAIAAETVAAVHQIADCYRNPLVILDSMHTHDHVLRELELYAPLVHKGSYMVVMDTAIEDIPARYFKDRPWGPGNSPKTAVWEFIKNNPRFEIDRSIEDKLQITAAPDGYLRCVAD